MYYAERLAEFFHTAKVPVVAVAILSSRNVKLDLVVSVIWLSLADIPWNTGATQHDTGEGVVESILGLDNADVLCSLLPDTVVGEELLNFIDTVAKLGGPLVNVVQETDWEILADTTGTNVGGVKTSARDTLIEFLFVSVSPPGDVWNLAIP